MNFIKKQEHLEGVVSKFNDLIGSEASLLRSQLAISSLEENNQAIKDLNETDRLLQVGIVGRVKAGKSSLINALIFDGKSVLPKAATPMTAALTILSYGETLSAEVDFYSDEDLKNIKLEHDKYKSDCSKLEQQYFQELKDKKKKKLKSLSQADIGELKLKSKKKASRELKDKGSLAASYDQYQRIQASGVSLSSLRKSAVFKAKGYAELGSKLLEYVGADGQYMPFTKSVHLRLPNEKLKDIQIVDTPGVNDPVVSREERTRELLKYCDVVLIVSPSGQFMSNEDTELMDRITNKEGVRELYVVASQVDNQLVGSIKRDSNGQLKPALKLVTEQLAGHLKQTLLALKQNNPEVGNCYDQLIEQSNTKVIYSSGISQTMISFWDQRTEWDASTQKAWENLTRHYPDYFSDGSEDLSLSNLEMLSNINTIHGIIDEVRVKKEEILTRRKADFIAAKSKTLDEYEVALLSFVREQKTVINGNDVNELKKTRSKLKKVRGNASANLDAEYENLITDIKLSLKENLKRELKNSFNSAVNSIANAEGRETETWEVDCYTWWNPFTWGDKETKSREFTTVRSGAVRSTISELTITIESDISDRAESLIDQWKRGISPKLIKTVRKDVDDEYLDVSQMRRSFNKIFSLIDYPKLSYGNKLPDSLKKSGTLTESAACEFLEAAQEYVSELKGTVLKDIDSFIKKFTKSLSQVNMSGEFFDGYTDELKKLEEQIKNKKLVLDSYKHLTKALKESV